MAAKILVVDDDKLLLAAIKKFLLGRSHGVSTAENGNDGLVMAVDSKPDLVLLDADLPGLDGHEVCRRLKKKLPRLPVIIMSGTRIEEEDVLEGFEGGADDYLVKPLSLAVMGARIDAVLRRYHMPADLDGVFKACGISLDAAARTAAIDGKPVALTRREFDLLATLVEKQGRVLSPQYLLEAVWGYDLAEYNETATVEVHISRLRKKVGPKVAKRIVSVFGHGYKFEK